jgi:sigma-54 dependent transcriptional regulator, acetoin dehydrogenase operon transcriptional activator AcoR
MTNTIRILNELLDTMAGADCLYAIVSDNDELQYARALNHTLTNDLKPIYDSAKMEWALWGIDPFSLQLEKHCLFIQNGKEWQLHLCSIEHLSEGHYWLIMVAPAHYPFALCRSEIMLVNNILTQRIVTGDIRHQVESANQYTFAIMNSLKFGVIAVNMDGAILYANDTACVTVNIRRRDLLKIPIGQIIDGWPLLESIITKGGKVQNEDAMVSISGVKTKFNLNVSAIQEPTGAFIGMVISLRELGNVYQIVNKYTGMQARFTFSDIVGKSQEMRKLIDYAKTVSDSPSTVLIEGESGTGKEVFAQSIHNASSRKDAGFVAINCAAISENLIESELFGYEDGAFTGAAKGGKPGKFELADRGTLFLDEVGDMKPDTQVKLLRAIQEGAITRVGGSKVISVDVRIIAATNKNLKKEVDEGRFRLDLYYRLSVIPMKLPPLRDRQSDLPSLIRSFLQKKSLRLGKPIPPFHYSDFQQLLNYQWPGNIRELENYIEQWVNLDGKLPTTMPGEQPPTINPEYLSAEPASSPKQDVPQKLEQVEVQHMVTTIAHCNGNLSLAAKILGIGRNTLYLKMKKHGLERQECPK